MDKDIHVSCNLHEQLEEIARRARECRLTYLKQGVELATVQGRITDIYSEAEIDWCLLKDGSKIRLDRIETIEQLIDNK